MWNSDTLAKLHNRHFADIKTENVNMINQNLYSLMNKHTEKKHRKKCECCPIHVTLWLSVTNNTRCNEIRADWEFPFPEMEASDSRFRILSQDAQSHIEGPQIS